MKSCEIVFFSVPVNFEKSGFSRDTQCFVVGFKVLKYYLILLLPYILIRCWKQTWLYKIVNIVDRLQTTLSFIYKQKTFHQQKALKDYHSRTIYMKHVNTLWLHKSRFCTQDLLTLIMWQSVMPSPPVWGIKPQIWLQATFGSLAITQ